MTSNIQSNSDFLRKLYRKETSERPAFIATPDGIPIFAWEDGDYTVSERPIERWVPWVVENYRKQVEWQEKLGDDAVPFAKLLTGTQLFAAAFGCPVHQFSDSNPCAMPLVSNAAEADNLIEPDLWNCRGLMRVFELGRLVQRELGPEVFLGPCDLQTGFDTACLIWDKSDMFCALADDEERGSVTRLASKCARLLKNFLIELRKEFPNMNPCHCPPVWAPPEMGFWLSNDECGAVSTPLFEEIMLPELIDIAQTFGGLGMHCCADAEHQFESFKKIPGFYGFNRVQAKRGFTPILDHLAGLQGPTHTIAWISDEQIVELVDKAPKDTRFVFVLTSDDFEGAKAWHEKMQQKSLQLASGRKSIDAQTS